MTQTGEFVQVLHDGTDHWLLLLSHPAEVYVHDSMYSSVSSNTNCKLASYRAFFRIDVQRQRKEDDCGLFALAFATSL